MLRYKPWVNEHSNALGSYADNTNGWVDAWKNFLISDLGRSKVPSWLEFLEKAETFLKQNDFDNQEMDREEDNESVDVDQEDWMINQNRDELLRPPVDNNSDTDSLTYWAQDRSFYSARELSEMGSWLNDLKQQSDPNEAVIVGNIDSSNLNENQSIAFNLVKNHLEQNPNEQLLLRMEGPGGLFTL